MATIEVERVQTEQPAAVDEVGQVLLRAADILRESGWCRYRTRREDGARCAIGAIGEAAAGSGRKYIYAYDRMADALGIRDIGIGFWNDRPERTKEQVIEAFERAAYRV